MSKLKGKKLLILGGSANEISLVERAKAMGVYTIVTDYYTDHEISPAKKIADEYWDDSWSDLDVLEKKCRDAGVDGIVAGYSEFRVENQIKLCQRLNLPCYCTMEQLDITRDKRKFKDACIASGVPVIHEYGSVEEVTKYPVIVKPVDRGGSIGISVATNRQELESAYAYAMEMSVVKDVIIEDYIGDATKIDVYYEIIDGESILLTSDDTINAKNNGFSKVVQSCWLLPSRQHDVIVEKADKALRRLLKNMGIQNGYIFISGFVDDRGNVAFFETGFRLCGGHLYDYFEQIGYPNNLDLFIHHALTGDCTSLLAEERSRKESDLKCVTLNFYANKGEIAFISDMEKLRLEDACAFTLTTAHVGQVCTDDKAILSKIGMVHLFGADPSELKKTADNIYQSVEVRDIDGNDLIYDRIDTTQIEKWWR